MAAVAGDEFAPLPYLRASSSCTAALHSRATHVIRVYIGHSVRPSHGLAHGPCLMIDVTGKHRSVSSCPAYALYIQSDCDAIRSS